VSKYKVFCFVDDQQGRDVELLLPLIYQAEKYLGCEVKFLFIWDIFAIYREQPDIVILANIVGSKWLFEIARYAHEQNIPVFALISEGNYRLNGTFDFWGYNSDKKFYQEYICLWSERTKDFFTEKLPDIADKMVLTGATGFDRYKIYQFPSKETFLKRKGLTRFKKVVGYAGWSFGKLFSEIGRQELKYYLKEKPDSWKEWTEKQMLEVEGILRQIIENNSDTLFILKVHPNETHPHITKESPNEMSRLKNYPNVLYIKNEEPIHDLISVSDIWMGFETTTAIEAWMLNKETVLINPDPNFSRDFTHKGSSIAETYPMVQSCIDKFYRNGGIDDFNSQEKVEFRRTIIKETIGFADGLNHLRAAYYLNKTLLKSKTNQHKPKFRLNFFIRSLEQHVGSRFYIRWLFLRLPKFKKTVCIFDRCKLKNIGVLKETYYPFLDEFYRKNNLDNFDSQKGFWEEQLL
jgi:surface carbohydrate biosynthesis protein